ncbi:hypothetical protein [Rhodoblastus sp.]|uniref:hypothetical protein n=1 Tax=Rhodoblastus sp. TaxID=1962975 RepID=UPI003F98638F
MNLQAAAHGFDPRRFSRRKARLLAMDIVIVVAALILWALLSHVSTPRLLQAGSAQDCVYLGRAGADCVQKADKQGGGAPARPACEFLGRAGEYCPPEAPAH